MKQYLVIYVTRDFSISYLMFSSLERIKINIINFKTKKEFLDYMKEIGAEYNKKEKIYIAGNFPVYSIYKPIGQDARGVLAIREGNIGSLEMLAGSDS